MIKFKLHVAEHESIKYLNNMIITINRKFPLLFIYSACSITIHQFVMSFSIFNIQNSNLPRAKHWTMWNCFDYMKTSIRDFFDLQHSKFKSTTQHTEQREIGWISWRLRYGICGINNNQHYFELLTQHWITWNQLFVPVMLEVSTWCCRAEV